MQGKEEHKRRNATCCSSASCSGILFNPVTGAATRKWLKDRLFGGGDDFTYECARQRRTAAQPS